MCSEKILQVKLKSLPKNIKKKSKILPSAVGVRMSVKKKEHGEEQ